MEAKADEVRVVICGSVVTRRTWLWWLWLKWLAEERCVAHERVSPVVAIGSGQLLSELRPSLDAPH